MSYLDNVQLEVSWVNQRLEVRAIGVNAEPIPLDQAVYEEATLLAHQRAEIATELRRIAQVVEGM